MEEGEDGGEIDHIEDVGRRKGRERAVQTGYRAVWKETDDKPTLG